jgi:D-hexose-6-phosphate mutarotase
MTQPALVTIASETLTAAINPLGAELWSITDRAGQQWMTDADPAFWTGHAPVLFPIVGSLAGDTLHHDGKAYTLPRHGFARRSDFALVAHDGATAHFRLRDSAETRAVYPFAFVLDMAFAVEGATLAMTATVTIRVMKRCRSVLASSRLCLALAGQHGQARASPGLHQGRAGADRAGRQAERAGARTPLCHAGARPHAAAASSCSPTTR